MEAGVVVAVGVVFAVVVMVGAGAGAFSAAGGEVVIACVAGSTLKVACYDGPMGRARYYRVIGNLWHWMPTRLR